MAYIVFWGDVPNEIIANDRYMLQIPLSATLVTRKVAPDLLKHEKSRDCEGELARVVQPA